MNILFLHKIQFANCYDLFRKLEEFLEGGKVEEELAKVRYDHYASKRKAKIIMINQQLQGFDPTCK